MHAGPKIALIGRTNVGKSSLFNRMVEEQKSLVSDIPGTTRDRFEADCLWRGEVVRLVDTGGMNVNKRDDIEASILEQALRAIDDADLIFFVVDLTTGPTVEDREIGKLLFQKKKPVLVVGNKVDTQAAKARSGQGDWGKWPLDAPIPVSAKRGTGIGDLLDVAYTTLVDIACPPAPIVEVATMRVAVLGEPNVGKSTLLNALLGERRFITADRAHTTREPNDAHFEQDGKHYAFVDTAGVRKSARVRSSKQPLESKGVSRSLNALGRADVVLLVLDVTKGVHAQEKHLAGQLVEAGVSVVIVANKWDLVPDKTTNLMRDVEKHIRGVLPHLRYAPVVFTSAKTGHRVPEVFRAINTVYQARFVQLGDDEAKEFISRAIMKHRPSRGKGVKHPRILSFYQGSTNPPTFYLKVNLSRKDSLADSYLRFLENVLREQYDFIGTPIRMRVSASRKSHTTYEH